MEARRKLHNSLESRAKVMIDEVAATPVGEAGRVFFFPKPISRHSELAQLLGINIWLN